VTTVDLDEQSIAQAQRNVALNQISPEALRLVHANVFGYAHQLGMSGRQFNVVMCDPPKFIALRDKWEMQQGLHKYEDLNSLATNLVAPGGLLITCSCSGLLAETAFEKVIASA